MEIVLARVGHKKLQNEQTSHQPFAVINRINIFIATRMHDDDDDDDYGDDDGGTDDADVRDDADDADATYADDAKAWNLKRSQQCTRTLKCGQTWTQKRTHK